MRIYLACLALIANGCASVQPAVDPTMVRALPAPAAHAPIVPLIDYHVHLLGPYALPLETYPPEVQLPAELTQVLVERAKLLRASKDEAIVSKIYTNDAVVLDDIIDTRWMRTREDIVRFTTLFSSTTELRMVAYAYERSERLAYVAGAVFDVANKSYPFNFHISFRKGADGAWRIASESLTAKNPPRYTRPITADMLIADLDKAGIRRALVLSEAFWLGESGPNKTKRLMEAPDEPSAVRMENDWTAQQVARFPDRLAMACGINPLRPYAIAEMTRCSKVAGVRAMKMNIGGGGDNLDLHDAEQVAALRRFFQAAGDLRMPIVIHLGSAGGFGEKEVRIFLEQIVSAAPALPIQIAHMSSGFQQTEALAAFANARAAGDPLARNLYFDLSAGSFEGLDARMAKFFAESIRKIGLDHVLYASDEQPGDHHATTGDNWKQMVAALPLLESEWRIIAANVAPYMK